LSPSERFFFGEWVSTDFLILLVLCDEVVDVGLCFHKLGFVHPFGGVPMEERLSTEHGRKLLRHSFEQILNSCRVPDEGGRHLESFWGNVTHLFNTKRNGLFPVFPNSNIEGNTEENKSTYRSFDVIWDPFNKVARVLVLDVQHLLINFLHGYPSTENNGCSQIPTMLRHTGSHHVSSIKNLMCQFRNRGCFVLDIVSRCQRCESRSEEVEPWEWNHVHCQFSKIRVQLSRKSETSCHTGHCEGNEMIQIPVGWRRKLQSPEANVIQGFIVNAVDLV